MGGVQALTEALRTLTGKSSRMLDRVRRVVVGVDKLEEATADLTKATTEASGTSTEQVGQSVGPLVYWWPAASRRQELRVRVRVRAEVAASVVCVGWSVPGEVPVGGVGQGEAQPARGPAAGRRLPLHRQAHTVQGQDRQPVSNGNK